MSSHSICSLTYRDAAKLLGLPVGTLYALVSRRAIPHHRLGPRLVRFDAEELQDWWEQHAVYPGAPAPIPENQLPFPFADGAEK